MRLGSNQPQVSAQLRRLRALTGDALLVRAGNAMTPTETAMQLLGPATVLLREADRLFGAHAKQRSFEAGATEATFRIAASDYLDPLFLPELVGHVKRLAPQVRLELLPLTGDYEYRDAAAAGEVDLVSATGCGRRASCTWPADQRRDRLPGRRRLPQPRPLDRRAHLAAEHVAPMPFHAQSPGVVDDHLASLGLTRNVVVRSAHFGLIPTMVAQTMLVLTTGRLFCSRYVDALPVRILRCPIPFPALSYYQLWHDVTHASAPAKWLREQVREVARNLAGHGMLTRRGA